MTTTTATLTNRIQGTEMTRRPSLEELVDRLIAAMFPQEEETTQTVAKSVHDARRLRQTGDLDGALAIFAGVDAGEGEREGSSLGLRRVAGPGAAQVRRPGSAGLQPGHGQGCGARSPR